MRTVILFSLLITLCGHSALAKEITQSASSPATADHNVATPTSDKHDSITAAEDPQTIEARRIAIRAMRDAVLKRLLKAKPAARKELEEAEGYGVFDAAQTNVLVLVTSSGHGILVDNDGKKETFMKMAKLGTGPGLGRKKFKQVLIFKNRRLLEQFAAVGADVSASADAVFKPKGDGLVLDGVKSFNPNLVVYQMTDRGVLLQANWGGVGYRPDEELNPAEEM